MANGCSIDFTNSDMGDKVPRALLMQLYSDLEPYKEQDRMARLSVYNNRYFRNSSKDIPNFNYSYGNESFLEATQKRVVAPIKTRLNKEYFTTPYSSGTSFFGGLISGPLISIGAVLSYELILIPAMIELIRGFMSLCQAFYYKTIGSNPQEARKYFRDGVSRLILSPALAILSSVAVAVELVRFFTRLIATLIKGGKSLFDLAKESVNKMLSKDKVDNEPALEENNDPSYEDLGANTRARSFKI